MKYYLDRQSLYELELDEAVEYMLEMQQEITRLKDIITFREEYKQGTQSVFKENK